MTSSPTADMVREFHIAYGVPVRTVPTADIPEAKVRRDLLLEEATEYDEAEWVGDLVGIADALADVVYVAYGTALAHGIDLDAVLAEVHRSNMTKSKLGSGGKAIKGPGYTPPDIAAILRPPKCWPAATLRERHERGEWLSDDELAVLARGDEEAVRG